MATRMQKFMMGVTLSALCALPVPAQYRTPPISSAEQEAAYTASIDNRATEILKLLALKDAAKSNRVHAAIVAQYRALRARDEAIDAELVDLPRDSAPWQAARIEMFPQMSKPLHDRFIAKLSGDLTPQQMDIVKDKMTYGKVDFTYSAYCAIIPDLTDEEKAKVLDLLKEARDEAMDGGSSDEKSAIFQKYKDQINAYLGTHGRDVAKATAVWSAKQTVARKQTGTSGPSSHSAAQ